MNVIKEARDWLLASVFLKERDWLIIQCFCFLSFAVQVCVGQRETPGQGERMTAYAFFVQTAREEQKRLNPGGSVVRNYSLSCFTKNNRFKRLVSSWIECRYSQTFPGTAPGRWNSLSEEEKRPYKMMAERDKNPVRGRDEAVPGGEATSRGEEEAKGWRTQMHPRDLFQRSSGFVTTNVKRWGLLLYKLCHELTLKLYLSLLGEGNESRVWNWGRSQRVGASVGIGFPWN